MACGLLRHRGMRDIDDEFDSTDVVRYVPLPVREIEREELTQPVDATMVLPAFDDSELEAVLAQLDEENHKGDYLARRR